MDIHSLKMLVEEYCSLSRFLRKSKITGESISLSCDFGDRTVLCSPELKDAINNLLEQRFARIQHDLSGLGVSV